MILGPRILKSRKDENGVTLYKECTVTGEEYSVTLTHDEYNLLKSPTCPLIQQALPHFTADQREFLITGITPGEWNATFPPEEEGDFDV